MALNPDTLRGARMGDRYQRGNAPRDKPVKKSAKDESAKKLRPMLDTSDFIGEYKPRTQETKNSFEDHSVRSSKRPLETSRATFWLDRAEEVLKILKTDSIREASKRGEVEDLIGKLKDERFAVLGQFGKEDHGLRFGGQRHARRR